MVTIGMTDAGRSLRWRRFVDPAFGFSIIVPIDHGLTMGPLAGINRLNDFGKWINHPAISGIIAHKGLVERLVAANYLSRCGVMIHLNGAISIGETPDRKELVTEVNSAIRLGADAVSIQLNFDKSNASHNLRLLGAIADEAHKLGIPVLSMVYDKMDTAEPREAESIKRLRHFMRATVELGTDALKVAPPASLDRIGDLLDGISDHTPVFFAGGSVMEDETLHALAITAIDHGASGLCVGRNVFQREDPDKALSVLYRVMQSRKKKSNIAA